MVIKSYADDPAKALAREKLRDFIRKTVMQYKRPKNISVVCFPGAEALEVYEVYDQLGIPRRNVLGLERDPHSYVILQNQNLGIRLTERPLDALDYFGATPLRFDVISLDYIGHLGRDELKTLRQISGRQILEHGGVLHTTYVGKRESENQQFLLSFRDLSTSDKSKYEFPDSPEVTEFSEIAPSEMFSRLPKITKAGADALAIKARELESEISKSNLIELRKHRDIGITYYIIKTFERGRRNLILLPIFDATGITEELRNGLRRGWSENYREMMEILERRNVETREDRELMLANPGYTDDGYAFYLDNLAYALYHSLPSAGLPADVALILAEFLISKEAKPYYLMSSERYHYISNTGSPMLTDLSFFDQKRRFFEEHSAVIDMDSLGRLHVNPQYLNPRRFVRLFNELVATIKDELFNQYIKAMDNMPERVSLEMVKNIDKPEIRELSKEDAISLLQDGIPIDEILEAFPESFTKRQLAALKAHVTIGTYKLR